MFMAEKPIITEEVKKQSNMAFKMRSGNKVSFKNMGSSPARNMKDGSYEHSFESPAKQGVITPKKLTPEEEKEKIQKELRDKQNPPGPWDHSGIIAPEEIEDLKDVKNHEKNKPGPWDHSGVIKPPKNEDEGEPTRPKKKSPAKQKVEKGQGKLIKGNKAEPAQNWPGETEGQDENKIFNSKGKHVGDWVDGKKVMHTKKPHKTLEPQKPLEQHEAPERYISLEGEWISNPPKKKKSPNKQKMEQLIPPRLKPISKPFEGIKPDYPTFEEKNPRLRMQEIPSMRAPEFVHPTHKMPDVHKRIEPMETYRVNPKPMETHLRIKTKKKKKK
jgi:hypothetical protein